MNAGEFVTGDGCTIAYRVEGPCNGPTVLLSCSLGTNMDMWSPQMSSLPANYRVIAYDPRGHGRSSVPAGAYGMDRLGRDVFELLDALSLESVHFCGLSLGGMIGQWLAIRAPSRLKSLAICNSAPYMGPPEAWDDRIRKVLNTGMASIANAVLERWFAPGFQEAEPGKCEDMRAMLLSTNPVGYAGCCAAIRDMDMRPLLPLITVPTLVVGGTKDPATPFAQSELIASQIKQPRLVTIDAAHLSNVEKPEEFSEILSTWLQGSVVPRAG